MTKYYLYEGVPGGGKTRQLVEAVTALLAKGVHPSDILCISYTVPAAGEINARLAAHLPRDTTIARTVHSLCLAQLRDRHGKVPVVNISDTRDLLGQKILQKIGVNKQENVLQADNILGLYESNLGEQYDFMVLRSRMIAAVKDAFEANTQFYLGLVYSEIMGCLQTMHAYQVAKDEEGAIDFDDMLLQSKIKPRWKYVFIDEAQDLSTRQWMRAKEAWGYGKENGADEVHIFRDLNQSIYRYSGADPDYLEELLKNETVERFIMTRSHRCSNTIAEMSNRILKKMHGEQYRGWQGNGAKGWANYYVDDMRDETCLKAANNSFADDTSLLVIARRSADLKLMSYALLNDGFALESYAGKPLVERWAQAHEALKLLMAGKSITLTQLKDMRYCSSFIAHKLDSGFAKGARAAQMFSKSDIFEGALSNRAFTLDKLAWYEESMIKKREERYGTALPKSKIRMKTIHSAKGEEADSTVVHLGLGNPIMQEIVDSPELTKWEMPVGYVALSRARERMYIIGDTKEELSLAAFYGIFQS